MRMIWLCLVSFYHKNLVVPSCFGPQAVAVAALATKAPGAASGTTPSNDASCDAMVDESNAEKVCAGNNRPQRQGAQSDDSRLVEDQDEDSDTLERPIWWDFDSDELFEYFRCAEVLYGYESFKKLQIEAHVSDFDYNNDDDYEYDDEGDAKGEEQYGDDDDSIQGEVISRDRAITWVNDEQAIRQQWAVIRDKYRKEVNLVPTRMLETDTTGALDIRENETSGRRKVNAAQDKGSVLTVPVQIGDAGPEKGRGVFATQPIPKGTLLIDLDRGDVGIFKEGHSWRKFAATLPRETACNFIEWSWVQNVPPAHENDDDIRNGLTIFTAFDESNLINNAQWGDGVANVRCGSPPEHWESLRSSEQASIPDMDEPWGPCRFHYYASRDISPGDELLINYGEFEDVSQIGWVEIGL